jgi:methionine-rich copper-binding protein CopC
MRRSALAVVLAVGLTAAAGPALAHAVLEAASPQVGAKVAAPPSAVRITFSEAVEPAFSSITVSGPPGFAGAGPARPVAGDRRTLAAPLAGAVPPGTYRVRWRVLSVDSHTTQGAFRFEVTR